MSCFHQAFLENRVLAGKCRVDNTSLHVARFINTSCAILPTLERLSPKSALVDASILCATKRPAVILQLIDASPRGTCNGSHPNRRAQPEPLTVSYMCQRQSPGVIFLRAPLMPPCAAMRCEGVGNSLVTHAVRRPALQASMVARRSAPPAPITARPSRDLPRRSSDFRHRRG